MARRRHLFPPVLAHLLSGAMLAGLATPAVWRARTEPGAKFLIAWIVPAWLALEIVATKLPHYVLPLYPAIAILIAGWSTTTPWRDNAGSRSLPCGGSF